MATENQFTLKQGYAGSVTITVKDADGTVVNLTGSTIYFKMKNKKTDTTYLLEKDSAGEGSVAISDATGGILTVDFTQAQTLALTKNATAELIIKYNAANVTKTKDIHVFLDKSVGGSAV
jgi:hypothetical protein